MESIKKLEVQLAANQEKQGDKRVKVGFKDEGVRSSTNAELIEAKKLLQNEILLRKAAEEEISNLRNQVVQWKRSEVLQ